MHPSRLIGVSKLGGVLVLGMLLGVAAACALGVDSGEPVAAQADQRLLDELVAKDAIREQIYNYARAADRMDKELLRQVWHPDGTANFIGGYQGAVEGFIEQVWALHATLAAHSHQMTNILIQVDGDTAVSETYVMTSLHAQPTEERATTRLTRGRYVDTWSKRDGRWAIDERVFIPDLRTFHEATGPNMAVAGRRDRTDPSYRVYPY